MRRFHIPFIVILLLLIIGFSCAPKNPYRSSGITSDEIQFHINYLASDRLEGRLAGSEGCRKAAAYIAREFSLYGLEKPAALNSYFQWFRITREIFPGENNLFSINDSLFQRDLDFRPLEFSSSDTVEGEVVFAGYGISLPEEGYDDYATIDVTGRVVLILRYSPDGLKGNTPFARKSSLRYKATLAREKGASAVLIVTGPVFSEEDKLLPFGKGFGATDVGIPVLSITREVAEYLISPLETDLKSLQEKLNRERKGYAVEIPRQKVHLVTDIQKKQVLTRNVLGWLPATEETEETIVIGAHYDHLGWGGFTSVVPDTVAIHNGADDNASGVAGVLELAQYFASLKKRPRNLLFITFSAEELGLLGSSYYVKYPVIPLENTIAMINMDMIGRMKDSTLIVGGAGTSPFWRPALEAIEKSMQMDVRFQEEGYGPSDHASFYSRDIPVLFLFTGVHEDYHKYSDDADRINASGEELVLKATASVVTELLQLEQRPQFTRVKREIKRMGRGPLHVYTGTIPDFSYEGKGYALQGVKAGGPADQAGLKSGDVILEFGGVTVNNIYDYMYALQQYLPGDAVRLTILRGDQKMQKVIILGRKD